MSELATKLQKIKDRIEDTTAKRARLEGERDALMKRLKDEHGFDTVAAAEKGLAKLGREIEREGAALAQAVDELAEEVGV